MALNNTERTILTRLGYTESSAPSNVLNTVRMVAGQVDAGYIKSIDDGLVEARAILEGRSTSTSTGGTFRPPVYPVPGGGTGIDGSDPTAGMSDVQLILMQYGGLSAIEAQQAIAENPITAAKYAQQLLETAPTGGGVSGGGGGGSVGRTQFESESRLQNANAAQIEQELAAIAAGTSRFQPFQGGYFDPQTGEFFDPSDVGLGRFNADTSRINADAQRRLADFQIGPQFQEGIRRFDQELALNALGEERAGKSAAAQAEIGFGNLGVDRAEFIRSVLNSPSDTLARLYMQRGGQSPLAKIEMADLLNSFNRQATNISNSVSRFAPNAALKAGITPGAKLPAITPTTTPKINPEYQYANAPFITPTYSDPNNYLSPEGDPWSDAAQSRLQTGLEEGSIVNADPALTPSNYSYDPNGGVDAVSDYNFEIQNGNLVAVPTHARGGYTQESRFIVGDQRSGKPTGHEELIVNPTNAPIQVVSNKDLPSVSRFYRGSTKGPGKQRKGPLNTGIGDDSRLWNLIMALAELEPPGGDPNVVDVRGVEDRRISRYDEGTGSFGDLRNKTLDAEPTGGFLNSLKEALGDLGEGFSRLQDTNRAATKQGLADFPIDKEAATGAAMGMAGYESVGPSRLFPRKMTPAERVKMAEEKGLPMEQIPLVDRLQAQYSKAREDVIKAVNSKDEPSLRAKAVKAARDKAKNLSDMLDEEMAKAKEQGQTVTEAMMDDYSNTLKQYKLVAKHADNIVERQTGGMYKTYPEFEARLTDLASRPGLTPEEGREYQTLLKASKHKTIRTMLDLDLQLNDVGQQMGQMRGGKEGIDNIIPGRNTADSIRRALDPNDEINRYANGTISRFAGGTDSILDWANTNLIPDKTTMPTPYTGTTSTIPTYNDTHSLFPTGDVTQQQLIDMSRIGTGPGGNSVLSGQMPSRFRIPGLQTPTAMQFNSLSGAERENLRPRLAAEFNSTLEDLMFDIEQRYSTGPSRMSKFRG